VSILASFGTLNYTILFIYLAVMVGVGLLLAGRQRTTEDYFLAGRRMPWLVVALSMFASLTSAISYMGIPGTVYKENTSLLIAFMISPIAAPFFVFFFYPFYRRLNVTTSYEYVARRYGPQARFAVSGLFVLARLGWLGTVIFAPALALSVVTGVNLYLAIALMGFLATAYTVMGGLSAVLWTDVLQFVILTGGAIWVAVSLILSVPDGFSGIMAIAGQTDHLRLAHLRPSLFEMTVPVVMISYFFMYMQDYGTDQVTVQRLLAVKTFRGMARAAILNSFFDLFIMSLLLFMGLGMFAYFHVYPDKLQPLTEILRGDDIRNEILPYYIMHALPNGVSGLVITGIFAAAMSSMDSGINSLTTVVVNDFVKPLRRVARSEESDVRLSRMITLAVGVFATSVSFIVSSIQDILKASSTFLSLFAGPILALFLLGIFSRRANFWGWLVGAAISVPATLWFQNHEFLVNGVATKVHWTCYFPFSFIITIVIGYAASVVIGQIAGLSKGESELTLWGRSRLGELK